MHRTLSLIPGVLGLALGCGASELDNAEQVRTWANAASAVGVYAHAYEPVAIADGVRTFQDPACPRTSNDNTTVTITGGCRDSAGKDWIGTATVVRSGGDKKLTLDGYGGFQGADMRSATTGTVSVRKLGASAHEFDVDLVIKGGMTTTISYKGSVKGDYESATTWSGSGKVEREGMVAPTGTVQATTVAEVLDNAVCSGQALSGQTTIVADDATTVITYDGATDCDPDNAAKWSVDGEDRGLISGITCSAADVCTAPALGPPAILLIVGLGLVLRR